MTDTWHRTACILCSISCGVEMRTNGRSITRVRGDKAHPASAGYTCEKALRLDHYQNGKDRLTAPLRRRDDGTFEAVDWDTAIAEVAARLAAVQDTHGGASIFYYGGGGQANHLGGAYGRATRAAVGSRYQSNALAQEKTGEFWVDGQLFGRPRCHTAGDYEHAEVAMFVGKNPWQSHGFPRTRVVLKEIARDPERALIVIDPRHSETADLADHHLQVRPGTDAYCLSALLAVLVEEHLVDDGFIAKRCSGYDELLGAVGGIDIAANCARAGVAEDEVRVVARRLATAASVSIFEDLGIQQAPHSTLNSYLEKLLYLVTGNFGKKGAMNLHTRFAGLGGGGGGGARPRLSPVGGHRIITGLIPCNAIPDEILTNHPDRFRAAIVESANPVHSLADSSRMREAFDALELVVVIDVAMTETARHAHYVLPAASQYEKWEAAFFTLEFPDNDLHLRAPVFAPLPGTLPEAEIHTRLVRALGVLDEIDLTPLHDAAATGRRAYAEAFFAMTSAQPEVMRYAPVVLYETLGPTLGEGKEAAAAMWGLAQLCALDYPESLARAGFDGDAIDAGNALFDRLLSAGTGVVFSRDDYAESFERIVHPGGRIHLAIPELLDELRTIGHEEGIDPDWPFVLSAGERRSSTANTIYRDPAWRRRDPSYALRINREDAARLGLVDGAAARVSTRVGSVETEVELTDTLLPGHVTLPNGLGLGYPDDDGVVRLTGVAVNELTSTDDRDWFAGTPWHKHVPARVEAV